MVFSCFMYPGHLHHTVRVTARDGERFSATLHVGPDGRVLDENNDVTTGPFNNGGRDCDFGRGSFEEI